MKTVSRFSFLFFIARPMKTKALFHTYTNIVYMTHYRSNMNKLGNCIVSFLILGNLPDQKDINIFNRMYPIPHHLSNATYTTFNAPLLKNYDTKPI